MRKYFMFIIFFGFIIVSVSACYSADNMTPNMIKSSVESENQNEGMDVCNNGKGVQRILFIGEKKNTLQFYLNLKRIFKCETGVFLTPDRNFISYADNDESSFKLAAEDMLNLLSGEWDILWLDFNFERLPKEISDLIIRKNIDGMKVVYKGSPKSFKDISKEDKKVKQIYKPFTDFMKEKPVFLKLSGEGTIVVLKDVKYFNKLTSQDRFFALSNLLFNVSGKTNQLSIENIGKQFRNIEYEALSVMKYQFRLNNPGEERKINIVSRFRNEAGSIVKTESHYFIVKNGNSFITLDYPVIPAGIYIEEVFAITNDSLETFSMRKIKINSGFALTGLKVSSIPFEDGIIVYGTVGITPEFKEGMVIDSEMYDSSGRLVQKSPVNFELSRQKGDFSLGTKSYCGGVVTIKIKFFMVNNPIQTLEKKVFVKTPGDYGKFDINVFDKIGDISGFDGYDDVLRQHNIDGIGVDFSEEDLKSFSPSDIKNVLNGSYFYPVLHLCDDFSLNNFQTLSDSLTLFNPESYIIVHKDSLSIKDSYRNFLKQMFGKLKEEKKHSGIIYDVDFIPGKSIPEYGDADLEIFKISSLPEIWGRSSFIGNNTSKKMIYLDKESIENEIPGFYKTIPWYCIFNGYKGLFLKSGYGYNYSVLDMDLISSDFYSIIEKEKKIINNGIGRIILGSDRIFAGTGNNKKNGLFNIEGSLTDSLSVFIFQDGNMKYAGFILSPFVNEKNERKYTVKINDKNFPYIYDLKDGNYYGAGGNFSFEIFPGGIGFFAFSDNRIHKLELKIPNPVIEPGSYLEYSLSVESLSGGVLGNRHVIRRTFIKDGDTNSNYYDLNFDAEAGTFTGRMYIPLDEKPGKWLIEFQDVISGKKNSREILIKQKITE